MNALLQINKKNILLFSLFFSPKKEKEKEKGKTILPLKTLF
jgi:hypothetical protein